MRAGRCIALVLGSALACGLVPSGASGQETTSKLSRAKHSLERAATERQTRHATERFDPIFRKYTKRYFGVGTDWRWFKAQGTSPQARADPSTSVMHRPARISPAPCR